MSASSALRREKIREYLMRNRHAAVHDRRLVHFSPQLIIAAELVRRGVRTVVAEGAHQ